MKLSLAYYLVQLRRIAEHREKGAEEEIQRIYKELLKDLQQFLGVEYARLAEDDRLTYEILQGKGEYARFLEEVERRLNALTPQASEEIQAAVEAIYELAYQGMVEAVQKSKTPESLKQLLKGLVGATPEIIKRAVENPISGLTLKDTLEKNRKEVIYNIKREIGVGLTQGDRMSTMARRISKQVDKDYRKAMTITRTEVHRVREAGFLDSAVEIEKTFQQSDSGIRMTKTWGTALDERVRPQRKAYKRKAGAKARKKHTARLRSYLGGPNHVKMEGVTVGVDELFDLGDGIKTAAPGQSGVAGHDINCRCNLEYDLEIPDETVEEKKSELTSAEDGGMIEVGSDGVALEYQRYGRNKNTLVNKTYIESGEYRRKFDQATDNPQVNKTLYDCAKTALKHRSGSVLEDMYWIDGSTGKVLLSVTDSSDERAIIYTDKIKKTIMRQENIVTIHTHPSSMPPSDSDLNSCFNHHYKMGFIACHNGKIFAYSSNQKIPERIYSLYVERFVKEGNDEFCAQMEALNKLSQSFDIKVWEVNNNE